VSIFFQLVWRNSLLKCVSQPKIAKKINKNFYFSVQGHPGSLNSVAIENQCTTSY